MIHDIRIQPSKITISTKSQTTTWTMATIQNRRAEGAKATSIAFFIRALALLCACSLSVGSHYASYTLAPLKSRLERELGTSNTEFSLLISAFSLNSTWTPLVGGVLASKLGTTYTSILATGVIFTGQALLLLGDVNENVRLMAFGLFIFGLGVSPLSVVQETIIVRFFKSHGLGMSMALGLVAGKCASFVSARTSFPLSERFGRHAPFYASTALAAFSVLVNLVYIMASRWLVQSSGTELEAAELHQEANRRSLYDISEAKALKEVAEKRRVKLREVSNLGDIFWAYMGVNVLCGTVWHPFTHLAANIFQRRYDLTESEAGKQGSYLLAGSMVLYPLCGFAVDRLKYRQIILRLFALSSMLTMFCYAWLALPPRWTGTPAPAVLSFASGIGFSPLLLVVMVPQLVPLRYVSTTLGAHKALEQTGSTIFQTFAGLALDSNAKPRNTGSTQLLLNSFVLFNIFQFMSVLGLTYLDRQRKKAADALAGPPKLSVVNPDLDLVDVDVDADAVADENEDEQRRPLLTSSARTASTTVASGRGEAALALAIGVPVTPGEIKRGRFFAKACAGLVSFAWVLFLVTAWLRLRSKEERGLHEDGVRRWVEGLKMMMR
ncbi:hypothetical protein SERLA73DRAFT_167350 [Serpula lacrymans var. lacrymans S7.3]|uniref:Lysosomal dipeptide transporter MFSD1 n=2 Tax=Serpula lacrymans var. lacrymans TaxID=341189 RepID=F8PS46_SERL3|nr:uncharacterized protein SERLADRAFT_447990 [Serpula lacrymans var. lacrymans S7.9]EGO01228.1 hypothetical protein SERLA73DRAFT_167350 [Serpula lacrymans var. lacrymans S7.3]EGO26878.1 hypothetical protein SERLADRAFT_447990 [Serpula lacrymans var. lacrymans S7.9]